MIVLVALLVFCGAMGVLSLRLSPAAGRLPGVVALLTLVPILMQAREEHFRGASVKPQSNEAVSLSYLVLLGSLYLAGFFITLPLYAGWCLRNRPAAAVVSMAIILAMLTLLHQHVAVYSGLVWGLMASAAM